MWFGSGKRSSHRHPRYEVLAFSSSTRLGADKWSGMLPLPTQVLQRKRDPYMGETEGAVARLFSHKWFLSTRARLADYGLKPLRKNKPRLATARNKTSC